jgi:hypothetical protein
VWGYWSRLKCALDRSRLCVNLLYKLNSIKHKWWRIEKVERSPSAWNWDVRFWILPLGIMKIVRFRNMTPCSLINKYGSFFPSFRRWPFLNHESHLYPKDGSWLHWKSACFYKILQCRVAKVISFSIMGYWVLKTNWNNCWGLITLAFWIGIQSKEQLLVMFFVAHCMQNDFTICIPHQISFEWPGRKECNERRV